FGFSTLKVLTDRCFVLDQLLRQRGQNADVRVDTPVLPQL
ncbi:hypothetical protein ACLBTQ_15255, partial [Pseudomonas aeruginosa]